MYYRSTTSSDVQIASAAIQQIQEDNCNNLNYLNLEIENIKESISNFSVDIIIQRFEDYEKRISELEERMQSLEFYGTEKR